MPAWAKVAAAAFLVVFVVNTWLTYGAVNFLWLSNIGLIGTVLALVLEQRALANVMLVLTLIPDGVAWTGDFVVALVTGWHPLDATEYMFDTQIPIRVRVMALYHPTMALVLVGLTARWGYDRRALVNATVLAWMVLLVSYVATPPERNVNWVYGLGTAPQQVVAPWVYLLGAMTVVPVVLLLPTHLAMTMLGWDRKAQKVVGALNAPN